MRFPRVESSNKGRKSSSATMHNGDKKIDGGAGTNNCRQVAPETHLGSVDYGSSRDDTFFEAGPRLDSDCDDEFYSVNGGNRCKCTRRTLSLLSSDLTPARSITSQSMQQDHHTTTWSPKLPTLGTILKAEPLKPQRKLADLLRESQDGDGDLSRADSFRAGQEAAGRCCVPQLARAVSCNGTGSRNK